MSQPYSQRPANADESLTRSVRRASGFVQTAESGRVAETIARSWGDRIDLLLTDVVMPEVGGVELAARLVRGHPELHVLFMSGYSREKMTHSPIPGKSTHFLPKPFTPSDLVDRVIQILEQGEDSPGALAAES